MEKDWLQGGTMMIITGNIPTLIQNNDIKIDELGRWIVILLSKGTKRIILIVMYRTLMSSDAGVYTSIAQYN